MKSSLLFKLTPIIACAVGLLAFAMPAQAYLAPSSFFDVFLESSSYPGATNAAMANISVASAPSTPIAAVGMRLRTVNPSAAAQVAASDPGGAVGTPGVCSFFDVWTEMPVTVSSFFDVWLEMAQPGGGTGLPLADTPTVVWHSDSFFDIYYELNVPGQGEQFVKMEFRVPDGQTVKFVNPNVQYPVVQSFFDVFLTIAPVGGGGSNPNLPLYRVVTTGSLGWRQPQPVANNLTKFKQNPDTSVRGLDVLAGPYTNAAQGTMLADDFICTRTGPISDIHIWGSWLNDKVDQRPTFWLGIWSDVPRAGNVASHPGVLLWWQPFYPGQYRSGLAQTVPYEQFYTPSLPPRVLGLDHQIWKYDFFPQTPFVQTGSPNAPTNYWLSVVVSNTPGKFFGWKTTPDHYNDLAVFAPVQFGPVFPALTSTWQTLAGPGQGKELSFMITTSQQQQWACNKTFYRPALAYANVRVRLPGTWPISGHYDGGGPLPLFGGYGWDWDADNNTVLDWSQASGSGDWVHVGLEGPGLFPPFVNWGWWDPYGYQWLGWAPQLNIILPPVTEFLPIPTNMPISLTNFWPIEPDPPTNHYPIVPGLGNHLKIGSLTVEYFSAAVPLAQLNSTGSRSPMRVDPITVSQPPEGIAPGTGVTAEIPAPPAGANFAVVISQIVPMSLQGQEQPQYQSTDWAMYPLNALEQPAAPPVPQVRDPMVASNGVTLTWTALPGTIYRVQSKLAITDSPWTDAEGDVIAGEATASKSVTVGGTSCFYRVQALLP